MRKVYNQKNMSLTIDGVNIQDFHEGATFVYTWDGGEVDKTQGTDGAGINIATNQGATLSSSSFHLKPCASQTSCRSSRPSGTSRYHCCV